MNSESAIEKAYEPKDVESKWYRYWLERGSFTADPARVSDQRPAYAIVIPPPNVTGMLHMGHVLNNTIQDILSRKARMDGREVLWLPGTDHAGIATQVQVEKQLWKDERKRRHDLGRDAFLERIWAWKEKHGNIIIDQLKKLGCSCDWTRERFTMDEAYSRCVQEVFVDLYGKGMIYRGKRMVNWCPATLTALSDEEVEMTPQRGTLWHFKARVAEEPETWLTIATTRPETIPGDTAVAVNPRDPRYARLIGKHVIRPLPVENQARIPIVGDDHIDPEFGTGVLKVTPAHDKADFEIGQRHGLPVVDVLNANGTMNGLAGAELEGLDRFEARRVAAARLAELGWMVKEEPYENSVGFSQRGNVPVEPRLSEQWFMKYPSVEAARRCVTEGALRFHPERWAKVYDHWMSNLQDWCISRQLWWGHRIPVWYRAEPGPYNSSLSMAENSETNRTVEMRCQIESPGDDWVQDPDVLDTWCSSWLWPFATMGWPNDTPTLRAFYPTTDLVTGPDIIFFWVARMIMAGYEFLGDLPFRNVYFTGIIRDKQGRKMSKSLGNSPDPLNLIGRYGADALRFGTMRSAPLGQDVLFDEKDVELGRNFCNKLWNACRFRQMQGGEIQAEISPDRLRSDDKWILLKLNQAIIEISNAFDHYKFNEATQTLYRFFWSEYCDWYVEASKAGLQSPDDSKKRAILAVIDFVLSHTLRLFHPFLPFITEELWHAMGYHKDMPETQGGLSIMTAPWPKPFDETVRDHFSLDDCYLTAVETRYDLVRLGRNLRREGGVPSNKKVRFILKPADGIGPNDEEVLSLLLNADPLEVSPTFQPGRGMLSTRNALGELYLPLEGVVDLNAERDRLRRESEKIQAEIDKVQAKLANPAFRDKAPPQVLQEHQKRRDEWQSKLDHVRQALQALV